MSDSGAGKSKSNGEENETRELARLLHDVADAQIKTAQLIDAFWRDLGDLMQTCEKAAQEIRAAARDLEEASGAESKEGAGKESEDGTEPDRPSGRDRGRRRRTIRIGDRGGREQEQSAALSTRQPMAARGQGEEQDREQERERKDEEERPLSDELRNLVAEVQRLVDLLSQK